MNHIELVPGGVSTPLRLEVISSIAGFDSIREEWESLCEAASFASHAVRFEWLREWWHVFGDTYGEQGRGLRILTFRRGGELAGALPLYRRLKSRYLLPRRLSFFASSEDPGDGADGQFMDLVCRPGEEDACGRLALGYFLDTRGEWEDMWLAGVPSGSPLLDTARAMERRGMRIAQHRVLESPWVDLAGGFDAYLARRSSNTRTHARQNMRRIQEDGLRFEVADDVPTAERFFRDLVELHQRRWTNAGKRGCFASRRFTEFNLCLIRRMVPARSLVICRLGSQDRPVVALLGFRHGRRFHIYVTGVDTGFQGRTRSPGIAAHYLLMQHLAGGGVEQFSFGVGEFTYKDRLATGSESTHYLHILNLTMRHRAQIVYRRLRDAKRRLAG